MGEIRMYCSLVSSEVPSTLDSTGNPITVVALTKKVQFHFTLSSPIQSLAIGSKELTNPQELITLDPSQPVEVRTDSVHQLLAWEIPTGLSGSSNDDALRTNVIRSSNRQKALSSTDVTCEQRHFLVQQTFQ
jgi:hypothetical protein